MALQDTIGNGVWNMESAEVWEKASDSAEVWLLRNSERQFAQTIVRGVSEKMR